MKVRRWVGLEQFEEYSMSIPVFSDDTIDKIIVKIALDINQQAQIKPDLTHLPYVWSDKRNIAFDIEPKPSNIHPWRAEPFDKHKRYALTRHSDNIWHGITTTTLNITFISDVPAHIKTHPGFFPDKWKSKETYDIVMKEATKLNTLWDASAIKTKEHRRDEYIKISFAGDTKNTVDIFKAIDTIKTSSKLPFQQFILDNTKILYKIYKKHNISVSLLEQAVSYERIPKIQGIVAVFPLRQNEANRMDVTARAVLDASGRVSVYYRIASGAIVSWDDILQHNNVIKTWIGHVCGSSCELRVMSMTARTWIVCNKRSLSDLRKEASKLPMLFHVDPKANEIVYKRSNNYKQKFDIVDNIKSQVESGIPEHEIIENLMNNIGISQQDATDWMQQYYALVSNADNVEQPKKKRLFMSTGCIVKIKQDKVGFQVYFANIGSPSEIEAALRWLRGIVYFMKEDVKQPRKNPVSVASTSTSRHSSPSAKHDARDESSDLSFASSTPSSSGGAGDTSGYFVDMLEHTDPDVFKIHRKDKTGKRESYSRLCGANNFRQPLVRSPDQMQEIEKRGYKDAIDDTMLYRRNYYFCPRIWCPKAMIPVKLPQLVDGPNGKKVCPGSFAEDPMYLYDEDVYWKKNPDLSHHIGFLDKKRSDKGLCLPCCMKNPLIGSKSPKAKARLAKCMSGEPSVGKPNETPPSQSSPVPEGSHDPSNTNFILSAQAPIPQGRYGTVSEELHNVMYPNVPYQTCSMNLGSTPCAVRLGLDHGDDSAMSALSTCLELSSKTALINLLRKQLTPFMFMSLDSGNVLQSFLNPNLELTPGVIRETQAWLERFQTYRNMTFVGTPEAMARQAHIFSAYSDFMNHLRSSDTKPISYLMSISRVLGYTLLIIDKTNEVYCPALDIPNVIVLIKDGDYYEPMVLKSRSSSQMIRFTGEEPPLKNILSYVRGSCKDVLERQKSVKRLVSLQKWIDNILIAPTAFTIRDVVLRPDLRIHGFLTKHNVLLEAPGGMSIDILPEILSSYNQIQGVRHMEDIMDRDIPTQPVPKIDVKQLMDKLSDYGLKIDMSCFLLGESELAPRMQGVYRWTSNNIYDAAHPAISIAPPPSARKPKNKQWYQTRMGILQLLLQHYDTLVHPLMSDDNKTNNAALISALLPTFKGITGNDERMKRMVYNILEQLPLSEGKDALLRWRRMQFADSRWVSASIHDHGKEWVFSQIAVEHGLASHVLRPPKGPVYNNTFVRNAREVCETNIEPSMRLIVDLNKGQELPSKWRRKSFIDMRVFGDTSVEMTSFVSWLAQVVHNPISYRDVDTARRNNILAHANDLELFKSKLNDPSLATFMKNYVDRSTKLKSIEDVLHMMGDSIQKMKTMVLEVLRNHGSHLAPCDYDWEAVSRLFDINIFMIRSRAEYRKKTDDVKRGDDNDRIVTSTLFGRPKLKNKMILFIYKDNSVAAVRSSYKLIGDKDGRVLFDVDRLPADIQKLLNDVKRFT